MISGKAIVGSLNHTDNILARPNALLAKRQPRQDDHASPETSNMTIEVNANPHILCPVLLISFTFIPKMEDARLMGMKQEASAVTIL